MQLFPNLELLGTRTAHLDDGSEVLDPEGGGPQGGAEPMR